MWEYDLRTPGEKVPVGEFAVRLSWSGKHQRIPFYPPIPTLVHLVGWGKEIMDVDVSATIDSVELAWAVTELLTGQQRPAPEFYNQYERLRAARALAEHFGVAT